MISSFMQADKAISDYFSNMTVTRKGVPQKVKIMLATPDSNYEGETYPCIVVMQMGDYLDNSRRLQEPQKKVIVVDTEGNPIQVEMREPPEPIVIQYGIRIYTNSQRDSAELKTQMRYLLKRDAFIRLNGRILPLDQISYRNPNAYSANFGEGTRKENRQFIDQYLVKLSTYLDVAPKSVVNTISEVILSTKLIVQELPRLITGGDIIHLLEANVIALPYTLRSTEAFTSNLVQIWYDTWIIDTTQLTNQATTL
jgi:hypothetical protein